MESTLWRCHVQLNEKSAIYIYIKSTMKYLLLTFKISTIYKIGGINGLSGTTNLILGAYATPILTFSLYSGFSVIKIKKHVLPCEWPITNGFCCVLFSIKSMFAVTSLTATSWILKEGNKLINNWITTFYMISFKVGRCSSKTHHKKCCF